MVKKKIKKAEGDCGKNMQCKQLVIEGTSYKTLLNAKFENRKSWVPPDPSKILSYIPGTILEIFVKEGQEIMEGDPVVILEAMKMRNVVTSPAHGKVTVINVKKGDRIPKGHLIVQVQ